MSRVFNVATCDASISCTETGAHGWPVLFLNGAFGTQHDWRRVLKLLDTRYRIITFDARGRGRSGRAREYSFAADLQDVAAIVANTKLGRALLVGWSHGAALAVRFAAQYPERVAGLVLVDGAFPISPPTEAEQERARRLFRRMAPIMRIMAAFGRSTQMSAEQAASLNIDLRMALSTLRDDYDRITCPVDFILSSKRFMGRTEQESAEMRATVASIVARRTNICIFRTVSASHTQILYRHPDVVVDAIDHVAMKAG